MTRRLNLKLKWALVWLAAVGAPSWATPAARLVSTSPQLTELLFQAGLGKSVVATPQFSHYPAAAAKVPVLGPLFFPGIERTVRIAPDVVLFDNALPFYRRALNQLGIPTREIDLTSPRRALAEARALIRDHSLRSDRDLHRVDLVQRCLRSVEGNLGQQSVLALVWLDPPILFGNDAYLSRLLQDMGAKNIAPRGHNAYPSIAQDWVIAHPPDRVVWVTDLPNAKQVLRERAQVWWPRKQVKQVVVSDAKFARASFTPILYAHELVQRTPSPSCEFARTEVGE